MKKWAFLLVFILLFILFNSHTCKASNQKFVPGEILIKFKPGVKITPEKFVNNIAMTSHASIDILNEKYNVQDIKKVFKNLKPIPESQSLFRIYKFKIPEEVDLLSAIEEYKLDDNIEYAELNYIRKTFVLPNDEDFSYQWSLNEPSDHDIDAPEAWDIEIGDSNIIIAIVDTGVDWDHPDLVDKIWSNTDEIPDNGFDDDNNGYDDDVMGWDFVDTDRPCWPGEDCTVRDNDPMDFYGHGTHCSGIVAAATNNAIGIAGNCWNCRIMPVRAGYKGSDGNGYLDDDDSADAIRYAADNGANVISMSFGDFSYSETIKNAVDYAYAQDIFLVAAAGNSNTDIIFYPAGHDNVMAVAATDTVDSRASFSNYGDWIDVAAPGVGIYSTLFDDTYSYKSGTSMATPHVAGLAALLKSRKSDLSNQEIVDLIKTTTDEITPDQPIGTGRINTFKAIEALKCNIPGASTECENEYPDTSWCDPDGVTKKTCDLNCQYSEKEDYGCCILFDKINQAWLATCTSGNWDPVADINKDKKVDLHDFSDFSYHFNDEAWCQEKLDDPTNPCVCVKRGQSCSRPSDCCSGLRCCVSRYGNYCWPSCRYRPLGFTDLIEPIIIIVVLAILAFVIFGVFKFFAKR